MQPHRIILLSIDPGTKRTGWALFHDESLQASGRLVANPGLPIASAIHQVISEQQPTHLAVEEQYLGKNFYSAKALIALRGAIEGFARLHQAQVIPVYPASWITAMLGKGTRRLKRAEVKRRSKDLAKHLYGVVCADDEADAILIGAYAMRRVLWEEKATLRRSA
jgi:Holliday junction resolvasome RuvABC endonuclease subunit